MLSEKNTGFTLIELMLTLVVAVILVTVAIPGFRSLIQNNRSATQANELLTAFILARSEAVKRGSAISACASSDQSTCAASTNWATGWIVFTDDAGTAGVLDSTDVLIRAWGSLKGSPTLVGAANNVQYQPTGLVAATNTFTLTMPDCTGNQVQTININAVGSGHIGTSAC